MNESTLWGHLRPELERRGKFQKTSDRFTPGIPDVLGMCDGLGRAWELKEFDGVIKWKLKFRPLQLDWLRDWELAGGQSLILSTHRQTLFAHRWEMGEILEHGTLPEVVQRTAVLSFTKTRNNTWREAVNLLLGAELAMTVTKIREKQAPALAALLQPMRKLQKLRSGSI